MKNENKEKKIKMGPVNVISHSHFILLRIDPLFTRYDIRWCMMKADCYYRFQYAMEYQRIKHLNTNNGRNQSKTMRMYGTKKNKFDASFIQTHMCLFKDIEDERADIKSVMYIVQSGVAR